MDTDITHTPTFREPDRLAQAFAQLTGPERRLLTCALAGNHPHDLDDLRPAVIRALAKCDIPAFGLNAR